MSQPKLPLSRTENHVTLTQLQASYSRIASKQRALGAYNRNSKHTAKNAFQTSRAPTPPWDALSKCRVPFPAGGAQGAPHAALHWLCHLEMSVAPPGVPSCAIDQAISVFCIGVVSIGLFRRFTETRRCALGHIAVLFLNVSSPKSSSDYPGRQSPAKFTAVRGSTNRHS